MEPDDTTTDATALPPSPPPPPLPPPPAPPASAAAAAAAAAPPPPPPPALFTPARLLAAVALFVLVAFDAEAGGAQQLLRGAFGGGGAGASASARAAAGAAPAGGARPLCASSAAMTEGGRWSSPPGGGAELGGRGDEYEPARCALAPAGFEEAGELCAELAERRLGALLFVGDSLAFNLEVDLRMNVFGETSPGLSRYECWVGRHTYFNPTDRGVCHDGAICGGAQRVSFVTGQKLEGGMRGSVHGFLGGQPAGQRAAVVLWLGAHYVADRDPVPTMQEDLAGTLRFIKERATAFPLVYVMSPTYWFDSREDGKRPWNTAENDTATYMQAVRATCAAEGFAASFIDMHAITRGAGAVHAPDSVHPDELVNSYVIGMMFQLLRLLLPVAAPSPAPSPAAPAPA